VSHDHNAGMLSNLCNACTFGFKFLSLAHFSFTSTFLLQPQSTILKISGDSTSENQVTTSSINVAARPLACCFNFALVNVQQVMPVQEDHQG
jgi:hypothetical protein